MGQIVSVTGSQMQFVAINWHVYLLTKSAFALGLVGLFRGLPIIMCSLIGGVVADAVDRKRLMVVTQTVMLASAALLTAGTLAGVESVWPIYVLSAIASAASAFDVPARQALMPTLVPAGRLSQRRQSRNHSFQRRNHRWTSDRRFPAGGKRAGGDLWNQRALVSRRDCGPVRDAREWQTGSPDRTQRRVELCRT